MSLTPTRPAAADVADFDKAVPSVPFARRAGAVARAQLGDWARTAAAAVPGLARLVDRPRRQPLRSGSVRMTLWAQGPFGTPAKPASLAEIPWDYVEARDEDIPFLGLREYWYPALQSEELRHNQPVPLTLLGDNLVFFRDAAGAARALENRCPHRSVLLSLGQVGVYRPGTITCRYHGMTFDGDGTCVAYLADGPDSPALGKINARSYPVEEHGGILWVWMGDDPHPPSVLDHQPHARSILTQPLLVQRFELPYSHLNMLDNATDLTHVGILHRSCLIFGDQKPFGEIDVEVRPDGGLHAFYKQQGGHPGSFTIDAIDWYLPNVVYHAPGDNGAGREGFFWFAPHDLGSFTGWLIIGLGRQHPALSRAAAALAKPVLNAQTQQRLGLSTLASCLLAGDAPMQASQGRIVRWDIERLARGDRSVSRARKMIIDAHRAEVAQRRERGTSRPPLRRPSPA